MGVAGVHSMGSSSTAAVSCFLVPRISAIHIPINGIPGIDSVECLRVIVAKPEVMDVFRQAVDIVVCHHVRDQLNELIFIDDDMTIC